jgi:arylsulfatase A-like enzyme
MKVVNLMFDSLNRHMLSAYGCEWTHTPNFQRLAQRTATFTCAYVGSMPCMPARRELHTGRYNFLHGGWSPMEPYDQSAIRTLKQNGVHTHLCSDHYHYWEEQSGNYHTKYNTWDFFRGQEGDPFIMQVADPDIPENDNKKQKHQDWINRKYIQREEDWPIAQTIRAGLGHIRRNAREDNWFVQIECFDPHEPWYVPRKYKDLWEELRTFDGPLFDWPGYCPVDPEDDPPEKIKRARQAYAASLAMCDAYLGDVLDLFDELDLWKDTMLIVNTDHGFLIGEHDWWAKNAPPWYEELSHIPLFIHDPRCPQAAGQQRHSFVQTIDLPATLLGAFGLEPVDHMTGRDLAATIADDTPARDAGLFGGFGHYVSVTDGRYVYMRGPVQDDGGPLYSYKLQNAYQRGHSYEAKPSYKRGGDGLEPHPGFDFTNGQQVWRMGPGKSQGPMPHLLFDLQSDPHQQNPLDDAALEQRMIDLLVKLMKQSEAPVDQYERLGLADAE